MSIYDIRGKSQPIAILKKKTFPNSCIIQNIAVPLHTEIKTSNTMEKEQVEITPLMKQFIQIQEKRKEAIVFIGVGEEYVTWQETAKTASQILGRQLRISETKTWIDGTPFMECSFPMNMSNTMLSKLVRAGRKVALCDQLDPPRSREETESAVMREIRILEEYINSKKEQQQ